MIPTFREIQDRVHATLHDHGGLAVILVDLAPLARVERSFGGTAYLSLRSQVDSLMLEIQGQVREGDVLARDEREGDRFLVFLAGRRDGEQPFATQALRTLADRVEDFLTPRIGRLTLPYLRERSPLDVGYGFVVANPLESGERQILRLIQEALDSAELRRRLKERDQREYLLEIVYNQQVWTVFQPIVEIESRKIVGHEALSRGPRGGRLEGAGPLFGAAAHHGLVEEVERVCRRQSFVDWEFYGAPGRLFVNTVPATVRDPSFIGRGVLDYLGPRLSPREVTLEITERQVIDNMSLYREAMHAFLDMGFSFAIDDVGAGYSGLEAMANLGAAYFKIDMGLVRDVHQRRVNQQVCKAILDMGEGVGATVIAEGIQTQDEADALLVLGVRYGQGYHFARPVDPRAPRTPVVAKNAP